MWSFLVTEMVHRPRQEHISAGSTAMCLLTVFFVQDGHPYESFENTRHSTVFLNLLRYFVIGQFHKRIHIMLIKSGDESGEFS